MKTKHLVISFFLSILIMVLVAMWLLFSILFDYNIAFTYKNRLQSYEFAKNATLFHLDGVLLIFIGLFALIGVKIFLHLHGIKIEKEKEFINQEKNINKKLAYLFALIDESNISNQQIIDDSNKWISENQNNKYRPSVFKLRPTSKVFEIISKNINQEEYFTAYLEKIGEGNIIKFFNDIESCILFRIQITKLLDHFSIEMNKHISNFSESERIVLSYLDKHNGSNNNFNQMLAKINSEDIDKKIIVYEQIHNHYQSQRLVNQEEFDIFFHHLNDILHIYKRAVFIVEKLKNNIQDTSRCIDETNKLLEKVKQKIGIVVTLNKLHNYLEK